MAMLLPEIIIYDGSRPESHFEHDDAEIKSFLWPFDIDNEPQTLQDIGFELNLSPEMMYLFVNSSFSGHFMHEEVGKQIESIPTNPLLEQPSQVSQVNAANHCEEESSRNQERVIHSSPMPSIKAKQKKNSRGAMKRSIKKRSLDDDSWMPEGWVKQVNQRPFYGKFPGYCDKKYYAPGVRRAFRSKAEALRYIEWVKNTATE